MLHTLRENLSLLLILLVTSFCLTPATAQSDQHVVSSPELHKKLADASEARQASISKIREFLAAEPARQALASAAVDLQQVERAIPLLNDEELARLATLAGKAQANFAGGALTNQELTYIIIALATAVIILIILHAR